MYHYIPYSADGGGLLCRDPADVREELASVRTLLAEGERRLTEAESIKDELLAVLSHANATPELMTALDGVIADCEERKATLEALWERTDSLAEELADAVFLLRGMPA